MDQDQPRTTQVTIDTRRSTGTSLKFSEILPLIPTLSSKGDFRLWSRSLRRALDSQDTEYWTILNEGPEHACLWELRTSMSCSLLALVGARVDQELQSVIASAHTPRAAWNLLKDHFTKKDFSQANLKYIRWIKCTYNSSMSPQEFVDKWRNAMRKVVEVMGSARFPYEIRLHQFIAATNTSVDVSGWSRVFVIDPVWSGSEALDHAFLQFIAFENRRLSGQKTDPKRSTPGTTITNKVDPSSANKHRVRQGVKRNASHVFFN